MSESCRRFDIRVSGNSFRPRFALSPSAMVLKTADYVIAFLRPRAKIIILTFFTYLALC
ncbi:MAG TPA: hypothetical protein VNT79_09045 [Phycisphaerae bacterium]|nr:hypothetical protein [Phycisphaerae bacterium]